jgi:hypothetical protein
MIPIHPLYRVAIAAWPNQVECKYKFVRYLEMYPKDVKAWITFAQSEKRVKSGEISTSRVSQGIIQSKRKVSTESMIRARKVLNQGLLRVREEDKCRILQAWGLLEVKHGKESFGLALLEKSVYLCHSLRSVLVWVIVRNAYEYHLQNSKSLCFARDQCDRLIEIT